jgi:hypothetical protein
VLASAAAPCPPNPEAQLTSATGQPSESGMKARCPCSCSDGSAARLANSHLDFAVARDILDTPLVFAWHAAATGHEGLPSAPAAPLEAVPI